MKPLKPTQENDVAGGATRDELVDIHVWPPYQIEPHVPLQPDLQPSDPNPEPTAR